MVGSVLVVEVMYNGVVEVYFFVRFGCGVKRVVVVVEMV